MNNSKIETLFSDKEGEAGSPLLRNKIDKAQNKNKQGFQREIAHHAIMKTRLVTR
jgi:hypothetical protein